MNTKDNAIHWKYIFEFGKEVFGYWFTYIFLLPDIITFLLDYWSIEFSVSWNLRIVLAFVFIFISAFRAYSSIRYKLDQIISNHPKLEVGFIDPNEKTKIIKALSFPFDLPNYPDIEELKKQEEQNLWDRYYKEKEKLDTFYRNKLPSFDNEVSIICSMYRVKSEEMYRKELSDYFPKYEKHLVDQWEYFERENHIRSVKIYLANYGTAIVNNIHLSIILFKPLSLDIDPTFILTSGSPSPPLQPAPIKSMGDILGISSMLPDQWAETRVQRYKKPINEYLKGTIDDVDCFHRRYEIKHIHNTGDPVCIDDFFIRFPKTSKIGDEFTIQTKIVYENLAEAEEEFLELILTN